MTQAKYHMKPQSVQVQYDVFCDWQDSPPVYRLYVNNELFTERSFIWTDCYLQEVIAIDAVPGDYEIHYKLIGSGELTATNPQVNHGTAQFVDNTTLRITNEST
jgi:hypothetical protein